MLSTRVIALQTAAFVTAYYLVWLILIPRAPFALIFGTGVTVGIIVSRAVARIRWPGQAWRTVIASTADLHGLGLALLFGLAVQQVSTNGVTSDGCIYFAHLRSLVFDHDLEIARELEILRLPARPHHVVPVGPAIVWAPLYLMVALVDSLGRFAGVWTGAEDPASLGLTGPYVRAALISSYLVAAAGVIAVHLRLRREFGPTVALASSLLLFGASSLVWYAIYEPAMTHAASFGLVATFLVLAESWTRRVALTLQRAALLGALFGLTTIVRPQDGLFGIFFVSFLFANRLRASPKDLPNRLAMFGLGALPFFVGQAVLWRILVAREPFVLAGEQGYLQFFQPRLLDVLFSSWHGFFSWTPVAYVGALGVLLYLRRDRLWSLATVLVFAAMWWVNASAQDWAGGWAFGGRRFTSLLAAMGPGLAAALDLARRRPLVWLGPLTLVAIQWNYYLMVQYNKGFLPKDAPIRFEAMMRQQAEFFARGPLAYPFAFPANVLFAWREGLPMDRYDVLGPQPLETSHELLFDAEVDPYLLEGWEGGGSDPVGRFRWLRGSRATVAVPLDPPVDRATVLELQARPAEPPTGGRAALGVEVNGEPVGRLLLPPNAGLATLQVPGDPSRRPWRRGYNRVTLSKLGVVPVAAGYERNGATRGIDFAEPRPERLDIAVYRLRLGPPEDP